MPGYRLLETRQSDDESLLCAAIRESDDRRVLIRTNRSEGGEANDALLFRDYEIARRLNLRGTLQPLKFERYRGRAASVFDDFSGRPVLDVVGKGPMSLEQFLLFAVAGAEILGEIHAKRFLHKQLHPRNILFDDRTHEVRLIGFELSEQVSVRTAQESDLTDVHGELAYISPEQTGRLRHRVDCRSDLYSLGTIFYRVLVGSPPFQSRDPAELVYHHLARAPEPISERRSDLPDVLSRIIMKLLEKEPEHRYQSAYGLWRDLTECLRQFHASGKIADFIIGIEDRSQELRVPPRLYGRTAELETIRAAVRNSAAGLGEAIFISGEAGAGKSALALEAGRAIRSQGGQFAIGKFDQLRRDVPYAALLEALQDLLRQLFALDPNQLAQRRSEIIGAVRLNAQVIVRVLPQLQGLLGQQPPVPVLGPSETTARFQLVMAQFIGALATAQHPLVLLLDDLQWADQASVSLIRLLMADRALKYLTIIAVYRTEEIQPFSPIGMLLREAREGKPALRTVHLAGLAASDIEQLLADVLQTSEIETRPLAQAIFAKTQGNAFFVKEFITSLYLQDILCFDPSSGGWHWSLPDTAAQNVTGNVVDLIGRRLAALPETTRATLQLAAVIGNRFTSDMLLAVSQRSRTDLQADIAKGLEEELILAESPEPSLAPGRSDPSEADYRFMHDRIQEAAYEQIDPALRIELHRLLGRALLRRSSTAGIEENLFDIANHLNLSRSLLDEEDERIELLELNLRAANKARSSAAYDAAWHYVEIGLELSREGDWESRYAILFALYREATELAYLSSRYAETERFAEIALRHARSLLDEIEIHEILIRYYNSSMRYSEAVETGLKAARLLDENLTPNPSKLHVGLALYRTRLMLRGHGGEALRTGPAMEDPSKLAAMRVMALTASAAYFARPNLFAVITLRMVKLSVRHGAASLSAFAYVCYGLLLCAVTGDMEAGLAFGELALATLDRFDARDLRAKVIFLFNVFIAHWTKDAGAADETFRAAAASGLETGDLEFFSYNLYMHCGLKLLDGQLLDDVAAALQEDHAAVASYRQDKVELLLRMLGCVVAQLRSVSAADAKLPGPFDEEEAIAIWLERQDYSGLAYFYCFRTFLAFASGDDERCVASARLAHRSYGSLMGQPFVPFLLTYESLGLADLLPRLQGKERIAARHRLSANRRKLADWGKRAPENYRRKSLLLEAEWCALTGQSLRAMQQFDQAIACAARDHSLLDEGVAAERAARFCFGHGLITAGRQHLERAAAVYARWGAPNFRSKSLAALKQQASAIPLSGEGTGEPQPRAPLRASEIDFDSVIRATRSLSQQVVLPDLLRELLTVACANAGATRGALLLMHDGKMSIAAEAAGAAPALLVQAEPVGDRLPETILAHAFRGRTSVLLGDATDPGPFAGDPYIRSRGIRSIVCLPLLSQTEIVGLLYLENNLIRHAFTPSRLEILRIFAGQAAVSIRNAELYANLERSLAEQVTLNAVHRRFVPHQFLIALGKERIGDVAVGDKALKTLSVMFADMRSYSSVSERLSPKDDLDFVNAFFGQIESAIVSNRGFVENYHGDGIMALFDGEADDAVRAGIALLRALNDYNEPRRRHGIPPVRVGVGINTGEVMLGTVGGTTTIKCSVIGDSVNLASRIENLTKHFDAPLLIGESTYARLKDPSSYHLRHVGRVRVRGRSRPVTLYEIFDADRPEIRSAKLSVAASFRRACEQYYRRDFPAAAAGFEACLNLCPDDRTIALFLERSRINTLGVPEDWDGTENLNQ